MCLIHIAFVHKLWPSSNNVGLPSICKNVLDEPTSQPADTGKIRSPFGETPITSKAPDHMARLPLPLNVLARKTLPPDTQNVPVHLGRILTKIAECSFLLDIAAGTPKGSSQLATQRKRSRPLGAPAGNAQCSRLLAHRCKIYAPVPDNVHLLQLILRQHLPQEVDQVLHRPHGVPLVGIIAINGLQTKKKLRLVALVQKPHGWKVGLHLLGSGTVASIHCCISVSDDPGVTIRFTFTDFERDNKQTTLTND